MHHLVAWPKELGGAGITPETGRWENVKAIFPLHNERDNQVLLRHLSRRLVLTNDDFDKIRDLLGAKVKVGPDLSSNVADAVRFRSGSILLRLHSDIPDVPDLSCHYRRPHLAFPVAVFARVRHSDEHLVLRLS